MHSGQTSWAMGLDWYCGMQHMQGMTTNMGAGGPHEKTNRTEVKHIYVASVTGTLLEGLDRLKKRAAAGVKEANWASGRSEANNTYKRRRKQDVGALPHAILVQKSKSLEMGDWGVVGELHVLCISMAQGGRTS